MILAVFSGVFLAPCFLRIPVRLLMHGVIAGKLGENHEVFLTVVVTLVCPEGIVSKIVRITHPTPMLVGKGVSLGTFGSHCIHWSCMGLGV